jgi:hypothetical protein
MRMDYRADHYGYRSQRTVFERVMACALEYVRSRNTEHWLMFCAGLVAGLLLG